MDSPGVSGWGNLKHLHIDAELGGEEVGVHGAVVRQLHRQVSAGLAEGGLHAAFPVRLHDPVEGVFFKPLLSLKRDHFLQ
jgi:hypothetical protein